MHKPLIIQCYNLLVLMGYTRTTLKTSLLRVVICLCLGAIFPVPASIAQSSKSGSASPVLTAAKTELDRNFEELKKQPVAPYYLSYEIIDSNTVSVSAAFGALVHSNSNHRRVAHIDIRVGDYALDNTRQVRGKAGIGSAAGGISIVTI